MAHLEAARPPAWPREPHSGGRVTIRVRAEISAIPALVSARADHRLMSSRAADDSPPASSPSPSSRYLRFAVSVRRKRSLAPAPAPRPTAPANPHLSASPAAPSAPRVGPDARTRSTTQVVAPPFAPAPALADSSSPRTLAAERAGLFAGSPASADSPLAVPASIAPPTAAPASAVAPPTAAPASAAAPPTAAPASAAAPPTAAPVSAVALPTASPKSFTPPASPSESLAPPASSACAAPARKASSLSTPRPRVRKVTTATWVQLSDRPPNVKLVGSSTELSGRLRGIRDGELVVVEFLAPWCRSCRAVHPKVVRLAKQHADVVFLQVDASALTALAWAKDVQQLPTFHLHVGDPQRGQTPEAGRAPGDALQAGAAVSRGSEEAVAVLTASPGTFSRLEEAVDRLLRGIRDRAAAGASTAPSAAGRVGSAPAFGAAARGAGVALAPTPDPPSPPPRPRPAVSPSAGLSAAIGVPIDSRAQRSPVSPRSPHSASIRRFGQAPDAHQVSGVGNPPAASAARAAAAAARAAAAASIAAVRAIQEAAERESRGGAPNARTPPTGRPERPDGGRGDDAPPPPDGSLGGPRR